MLRVPSISAVAAPDIGVPPEATTPTSANCDAPEKMSTLKAHVCKTVNPDVTAIAPKEKPYAPVATPTPSESMSSASWGSSGR